MTQHTPGPWAQNGNLIEGPDGETVAYVTAYNTMTPRQKANASLISAAPELLAALEGMEKWASSIHDGYPPSTASIAAAPYREAARAAIAEATGDDDAAPECTCAAKDMPFGRCCKVTPNAAVQPRAEGTSRCND